MYWFPYSRPLLKLWAQNFKINIGSIGTRINEPASDIAKAQANMDKLLTDIGKAEQARSEWERLTVIMNASISDVGEETRQFVGRLKGNPLFTANDGNMLKVVSTTPIADLTDYKAVINGKETGGGIHISFKKYGADGMNIYGRQQGEPAFKLLLNAKRTPYVFMPPAAATGVVQVFEFYGILTLANTEVGLRSETITVNFTS